MTLPWPPPQCSLPTSPGRGAGDPETVVSPGALLCDGPALRPRSLAAWAPRDLWAPGGAGEAPDSGLLLWDLPLPNGDLHSFTPARVVDGG